MAENLVISKKDRAVLRSSIDRYINKIEELLQDPQVEQIDLEEILEQLTETASELKIVDSEIKKLIKDSNLDAELQSAEEYREKIVKYRFRVKKKLNQFNKFEDNSSASMQRESNSSDSKNIPIKLPKLEINKFYGNSDEWLGFWNTFESAIHNNESLNDIDKLNYLKSYLEGKAQKTIEGFAITAENYSKCIDLLTQRYGKTDFLINTHMNNLLNLKFIKSSNDIKSLRILYDNIQTQIRSLESLNINLTSYGPLLSPILLKLLPEDMIFEFNKQHADKLYEVNDIIEYLSKYIASKERTLAAMPAQNNFSFQQQRNQRIKNSIPTATALKVSVNSCIFCEESEKHTSEACPKSVVDRKASLRKHGICYLCMKKGNHLAKNCLSKIKCDNCGWRHNKLICDRNNTEEKKSSRKDLNLTNKTYLEKVLLQTLIVKVQGKDQEKFVRCLIDTGSQRSYISKFLANAMNYESFNESSVIHSLFGGTEVVETHKQFIVRLSSVRGDYHCNFKAFDQTKICSDIPQLNIKPYLNELKTHRIFLNDVENMNKKLLFEYSPTEIHILIGADIAGKLFTGKIKKLKCGLVCIETYLGWNVMGKIPVEVESKYEPSYSFSMLVSDYRIADLWKLDTLGILDPSENQTKKELEEQTMKHFLSTVKRDEDGRFQVCLPWIEHHSPLPNYKKIAEKRLRNTVKNLKNGGFLDDYEEVFRSWEKEKIIEIVPENEIKNDCHYLPHRAVIRMNSKTTKIRPVFDGSVKIKGSPSINDCLEKGPNLIETVPAVINRFRMGNIGVSADIKKAFLQIGLSPEDRDYLRFLWWEQGNPELLKIYRHRRVVFGISSSPFLLNATLTKLINEVPEHLRETANKLAESWYVDNLVSSVNDELELMKFKNEAIEILSSAKFELQEWAYNCPLKEKDICIVESTIEHSMSDKLNVKEFLNEPCETETVNILGLLWNLNDDTLSCDMKGLNESKNEHLSKRTILSEIHKIYDPIGFTCPITITPKILLQNCWALKLNWDEALPEDISKKYMTWKNDASRLVEIRIPRCMLLNINSKVKLSFHIFCDASQKAYANCIYLRSEGETEISSHLIQARARVAPLKPTSICRLELLACVIGVRLMKSIKQDLKVENIRTFYWTDSMNTLYWIKNEENWGTFVMNRVKEIRTFSQPEEWNYVPGKLNPANIPSRGCSVETIKEKKWLEGPAWLKLNPTCWPICDISPDRDVIDRERKKTVISSLINIDKEFSQFSKISSFEKIVRVTAWMKRFIDNCRDKVKRTSKNLQVEELNAAEVLVFKIVQKVSFKSEKDEGLRHLKPFVDSPGLL